METDGIAYFAAIYFNRSTDEEEELELIQNLKWVNMQRNYCLSIKSIVVYFRFWNLYATDSIFF